MKPVKLSEVKVGDTVQDMKGPDSALFKVAKITRTSVMMKYVSGDNSYKTDELGFTVFSIFSNQKFYLPKN